MIQVMTVVIDKPEVDRSIQTLLVEELIEIYSTPTPKGWREVGKVIVLIDCVISFTITGAQYLYPEPKHESYSNTTHYNSWNKKKYF